MNWTQSKIDTLLKMAVCLAMIGSMVGCSDGSSPSPGGATTPALSMTSSDWTYPDSYFPWRRTTAPQPSVPARADSPPIAQSLMFTVTVES
jgi:hypothetical protein